MGLLTELAANLWWSWNPRAIALFKDAAGGKPSGARFNPVSVVQKLTAARGRQLAADEAFMTRLRDVLAELRRYLSRESWHERRFGQKSSHPVAYFSMEYAVHESLPLYAGGLGVLAGDHLKSASDLGVPLVAIGIFWRKGYTQQRIDRQGRAYNEYPTLPSRATPLREVTSRNGRPLRLRLPVGTDTVSVRAWRMDVGRVPLFLLDTDLPENPAKHRRLVHRLYDADRDVRIRQEILLGIGGWRLLRAMKLPVSACHLNEGHAAFLSFERIAERMETTGESFAEACKFVASTSVFTTHTPVPEGNEEFDPALVDRYLSEYLRRLKLDAEAFHDLARVKAGDRSERFGMTPLALRTARYANGVSALHGQVARRMWKPLYPGTRLKDVPIGHVTNGIHLQTWLHPRMGALLDEFLGSGWADDQDRTARWARVQQIPDARLWKLHHEFKEELVGFCRERLKAQWTRAPRPGMHLSAVDRMLDPDALTIGFARRFAPYKRSLLVFADLDRLSAILNRAGKPIQIVFAGKAHPADEFGKSLAASVVRFSLMPAFRGRIVFLEDYDMEVARHLVAGCDLWLNNPQRPREASGTSGMKPAVHGGLNLSILDGWWPEACNGQNGWPIGRGEDYDGSVASDNRDAADIYRSLEKTIVPAYYERDTDGLPRGWIRRMKNALATIPPQFNSHRQVKEYLAHYYRPASSGLSDMRQARLARRRRSLGL